jgi:high-affinity K+ transport system ATPase subunit B
VCEAGDVIPSDGDVVEGIASVDESAITGESAPVIRESGGDHSAVTGGTRVISDRIVVRVTSEPGNTFLDRMISMVESATRGRTPNEIALGIPARQSDVRLLLAVGTLRPIAQLSEKLRRAQSGVMPLSSGSSSSSLASAVCPAHPKRRSARFSAPSGHQRPSTALIPAQRARHVGRAVEAAG